MVKPSEAFTPSIRPGLCRSAWRGLLRADSHVVATREVCLARKQWSRGMSSAAGEGRQDRPVLAQTSKPCLWFVMLIWHCLDALAVFLLQRPNLRLRKPPRSLLGHHPASLSQPEPGHAFFCQAGWEMELGKERWGGGERKVL